MQTWNVERAEGLGRCSQASWASRSLMWGGRAGAHLGQRELARGAHTIGKARAGKRLIRAATAILSTSPDYVSIFLPLPSFCRTP